jgi:Zn-dependent protease with chaperone function
MLIPFELIFAIMALTAAQSAVHSEAAPLDPLPWAVQIALVAVAWLPARIMARRSCRRLAAGAAFAIERARMGRWTGMHQWVIAALFAADVFYTDWPACVLGPQIIPLATNAAGVLPFIAAMAASWGATAAVMRHDPDERWTAGSWISRHLRYRMFFAAAWLALNALGEADAASWPGWLLAKAGMPLGPEAAKAAGEAWMLALAAAAVIAGMPLAARAMWRCRSMPAGPERARLEALCARAGVKFRDILIWEKGARWLINAAVLGMWGRFRYVLFSERLLAVLPAAEADAVLAHELGHARQRHIPWLIAALCGFLAVVDAGLSWAPPGEPGPVTTWDALNGALAAVCVLALFMASIFGPLMRLFERQADAEAARLTGRSAIAALERLAGMTGGGRHVWDWRHYSIAERVRFLEIIGSQPRALRAFERRVRAAKIACLGLVALGVAGLVATPLVKESLWSAERGNTEQQTTAETARLAQRVAE